jgi:L-lactate dehydrogenase complex protein LldG
VIHADTRDEFRAETLALAEAARVGLTGADAAVASTATLVVTTAPGKGRLATILPPVHIAVITLDQIVARLEDWVALQRADDLGAIRQAGNFCLISGPSRTGDIEMQLVLGVHGPGRVQVVVKR